MEPEQEPQHNWFRYSTLSPQSARAIGDPLTSAIACTIAKTTGKQLTIEAINITPDMRTLEATYQLREG